jgi:release factor glutamine methyltransferase
MTIRQAELQLSASLGQLYEDRECSAIANLVMEHISGWTKIDRLINKSSLLSLSAIEQLNSYTLELQAHRPVQYVLQQAWFYGLKLYVDENVLIPRPETEELVRWIAEEAWPKDHTLLDLGTGSGCIALALKRNFPEMRVVAADISREALEIARSNADSNQCAIELLQIDFLKQEERDKLPFFNTIVSNPPYVSNREKGQMQPNVLNYEPSIALFVPDDDPLIFYKALADFGQKKLLPGGKLFAELHEKIAPHIKQLLTDRGYPMIEIRKDMQGKERLLKATWLP